MITVLFGQPNSGKSTLASEISAHHHIDGDTLRDIFKNRDYSKEGRIKNNNRASDIAAYLNSFGNDVVISLVYPYKETRDYLNSLCENVKWIYLEYEGERGRESFHVPDFDYPMKESVMQLNTSRLTIDECVDAIQKYVLDLPISHNI
jgi:gluconate kinase